MPYQTAIEEMGKFEITCNFNNFMCPIIDIIRYSVFSDMLCKELQRNDRSLLASHHRKSVFITVNVLMTKTQSLRSSLYTSKMSNYREQPVVSTHNKL